MSSSKNIFVYFRNKSSARSAKTSRSDGFYGAQPVKFRTLFRFCTPCERFSLVLGVFFAFIAAIGVPLINLVYGEFTKVLIDRQYPSIEEARGRLIILEAFGAGKILVNASQEERMATLQEDAEALAISILVFATGAFVFLGISVFIFNFVSVRQINRIRIELLRTLLSQSQAWYDVKGGINFTSKVSEDLTNVQNGTGERLSIFIYQISISVIILGTSLYVGWLLTLVLMGCLAPMLIIFIVLNQIQSGITANEIVSVENSTHVAEEAMTNVRTVYAFNGEEYEKKRYWKKLLDTQGLGIMKSLVSGFGFGFVWVVTYSCFAVAFALGFRLIIWLDEYTTAVLITVLFSVLTAATSLTYSGPYFDSFAAARGSAASIFGIIGTKSDINPFSSDGISNRDCSGEIEFKNVHFHYPSNPEVKILKGLNLKINPGERVAIIGSSGAGKSTVFQLIQRFYDPVEGEIFLDGLNLKSLNVAWLRSQITAVLQEPKLFSTSIGNNIAIGLPHAKDDQVIEAAKKANAHNFIMRLTNDYQTHVEGKDANLSGGQKQRIAIARALIRTSKIFLLDEVTSALDRQNEIIVGRALAEAAVGRTTLTITHKISSLTNVDRIIILNDGVVAEEGTHEALLNRKGIYSRLFKAESENLARVNASTGGTARVMESKHRDVDEEVKFHPGERGGRFSDFILQSAEDVKPKVKDDRYIRVDCCHFLGWNKSHWPYLYFGVLASVLLGFMLPTVCILYGELVGLLDNIGEHSLHDIDILAIVLVIVGLSAGILTFIQMCFLGIASVRLATYLKLRTFETIMRQEMAWFDSGRNSVSILCSLLNNDSSSIQGVVGSRVGAIIQGFTSMLVGFCISVYYSWKMALVTLVAVPFIFIGIVLDMSSSTKQKKKELAAEEKATKMAYEAIKNIRVVNSLGKESFFLAQYTKLLKTRRTCGHSFLRGFAYSLGQTTMFFGYALSLWYGANLMQKENLHYKDVIRISELIIYGCWMLGQAMALAPNFKKASDAAGRLQYLYLRPTKIRSGQANLPQFMTKDNMLEFSNVYFSYPTRPESAVLRNINLAIREGESIAIVGQSGSGKSTILQLILRLYDPNLGFITMKSRKLQTLKLSMLRNCMGFVSQEPVLFDRTIYENIAYGDNGREVDLEEVVAAAKAANIHSFIDSLPLGYDTRLGPSSNSALSGGQKQMIAIARVLIRNPKILLLDEATSALDPASEKSIQETLDSVMPGRTTITVAHKWGAIARADIIYVMENGRILESGTHSQLMKLGGIYSKMREAAN